MMKPYDNLVKILHRHSAPLLVCLPVAGCAAAPLAGPILSQAAPAFVQRALAPADNDAELDSLRNDMQAILQIQCDQILAAGKPVPDACLRVTMPAAGAATAASQPQPPAVISQTPTSPVAASLPAAAAAPVAPTSMPAASTPAAAAPVTPPSPAVAGTPASIAPVSPAPVAAEIPAAASSTPASPAPTAAAIQAAPSPAAPAAPPAPAAGPGPAPATLPATVQP